MIKLFALACVLCITRDLACCIDRSTVSTACPCCSLDLGCLSQDSMTSCCQEELCSYYMPLPLCVNSKPLKHQPVQCSRTIVQCNADCGCASKLGQHDSRPCKWRQWRRNERGRPAAAAGEPGNHSDVQRGIRQPGCRSAQHQRSSVLWPPWAGAVRHRAQPRAPLRPCRLPHGANSLLTPSAL